MEKELELVENLIVGQNWFDKALKKSNLVVPQSIQQPPIFSKGMKRPGAARHLGFHFLGPSVSDFFPMYIP
ncbi:MAG: hypothetical protein AAGN35_08020 [Bacteroidota bacterium]